jgi:arylsulfatase A-like enzyme
VAQFDEWCRANPTWPTYRGFDRFYGFLEGETGYFFPARIVYNNIVAPIDAYPEGYYATDDWMDKAIGFVTEIRNQDSIRPFFLYVANNAVHGPLQAKTVDLAKYRGHYDAGWDALRAARFERQMAMGLVLLGTRLSERDPAVPAWEDVPADQRRLFARHMETYAAMLDCADQNVGRLVALLDEIGELSNTIFVFSSDNGGTNSAGPSGALHSTGATPGCRHCRSRSTSNTTRGSALAEARPSIQWGGRRSPMRHSRPTRPTPAAADAASALLCRGSASSRISAPSAASSVMSST